MADTTKKVVMGLSVDEASVNAAVKQVKDAVQGAFKNVSIPDVVQKTQEAADEMKKVHQALVAYKKAQDEDLTREEVAMAQRLAKEQTEAARKTAQEAKAIAQDLNAYRRAQDDERSREEAAMARRIAQEQVAAQREAQKSLMAAAAAAAREQETIQGARIAQAAQVNAAMTAQGGFGWITGGMDPKAREQTQAFYQEQVRLAGANKDLSQSFLHLNEGIKGYVQGLGNLLAVQARWYGARAILFASVEAPVSFIKMGYDYVKQIDTMQASLLRWGASSGQITDKMKQDVKGLNEEMQRTVLEVPITFEKLGKGIEGFVGAGIDPAAIKEMTKYVAALSATYPEMDMEKFGRAAVGFYNSFKDSIKGAQTEAEKFKLIMDELSAAQAKGVLRPEEFTVVLQNLGETARLAGFSTEQFLAMSVVVTDLGSKAGSATRSLRGMIDQLAKPAVQTELRRIGIEFDRNKTMAEQFDGIMTQLAEKLGTGGPLTMGAMRFLTTIMPVERMKSFTALLNDWDKYKDTIAYISGAKGGVMTGLEPKLGSIEGQWQLFKNTLQALAKDSTEADGVLKPLVATMLDMARGALYAMDPVLATSESMKRLGEGGRTAYEVTRQLHGVLSDLRATLAPIWDGFVNLVHVLADHVKVLEALAGLWVANKVGISVLSTALGVMTSPMLSAAIGAKTLTEALKGLGAVVASSELLKLISAFGPLAPLIGAGAVAAGGLGVAIWQINKEARDAKDALAALVAETSKLSRAEIEAKVAAQQKVVAGLQADVEEHKDSASNTQINRINRLKAEEVTLKALQGVLAQVDQQTPAPDKTREKKPGQDLDAAVKQFGGMRIAAAKEMRDAELAIAKSNLALALAQEEEYHKLTLTSDAAYYAAREKSIRDALDIELRSTKAARDQINADYKLALTEKGVTGEKKKALADKHAADLKANVAKEVEARNNADKQIGANVTAQEQNYLAIAKSYADSELKITQSMLAARQTVIEATNKRESETNQYLYDQHYVSASSYYARSIDLAQKETQAKKQAIDDQMMLQTSNLKRQQDLYSLTPDSPQYIQLGQQIKEAEQKATEEQVKADQGLLDVMLKINLQMKENLRLMGEQGRLSEILAKAARDVVAEYNNVGQNVYDAFKGAAQGMDRAFTTFFDIQSKNAWDFKVLMTSIANDIEKEMVHALLVKRLVGGITNAVSGGEGGFLGGLASLFGRGNMTQSATGVGEAGYEAMSPDIAFGTGMPAYAEGTDYVPQTGIALIHQGEKITPASQNNGGAPVVNIINNGSNSKVSAAPKFDVNLKQWVVGVMIEDHVMGGPYSQARRMSGDWNG